MGSISDYPGSSGINMKSLVGQFIPAVPGTIETKYIEIRVLCKATCALTQNYDFSVFVTVAPGNIAISDFKTPEA